MSFTGREDEEVDLKGPSGLVGAFAVLRPGPPGCGVLPGEIAPGLSRGVVHGAPGAMELGLNPKVRQVEVPTELGCSALFGPVALATNGDGACTHAADDQQQGQADGLHH